MEADQDSRQKVSAIAEYDYVAKENDEIDLLKGQIIQDIIKKSGGWWEGTVASTGKRGMFPDNFVRVIEDVENVMVVPREQSHPARQRCKAIYSYTRVNEDELCLAVGDIIDFLTEVEEGWWRGKLNNKVGLFPSNFVVTIPNSPMFSTQPPNFNEDEKVKKSKPIKGSSDINKNETCSEEISISNSIKDTVLNKSSDDYSAPDLPPRPNKEYCRVEFPYSPQNDDELELVIGQIITIVDKDLPDKGWWKGEVNKKIGVFPDNFVKLLPLDVPLEKDVSIPHSKSIAKETTKKGNSSIVSSIIPPAKGFERKDEAVSNKKETQSRHKAAQKMSLENINIELTTQSTFQDSKTTISKVDDKKVPPPLPTKKPLIPGKKTLTNVTGSVFSGLRQKVKSLEQQSTSYQDVSDGNILQSNNVYNETRTNNERIESLDENLLDDSEFDKVQRASILLDMRAGRVKAPKRRPPSVSTSLMTKSIYKNSNLNIESDEVFHESETVLINNDKEQVKHYGAQKVPWMDELKASQIKMRSIPYIEPRTTLVNINNGIKTEDEKPSVSVITNVSTKIINVDSEVSLSRGEKIETKSSYTSFDQSSSSSKEKKIESEVEMSKSISEINIDKVLLKDKLDDFNETNPPKSLHSKTNVKRVKTTEEPTEIVDSANVEGTTIIKLSQRLQKLEATVQMQQDLIEDLKKMLHNESNRVELLKNQLDKYAQCVTQV
ncbi:SH3 domain-containing kinase-binding protein 1 [Episyrphus balteatus]|uniref:SH3 domain-containing kinase-binding protein 1 n=1 Tax=Episyrphus balteatus TaxID=286459 RepID=UPI002485E0EB|nr:SH3 domain-containing kinase-binding protein 1 [Episyrphus balteatus]